MGSTYSVVCKIIGNDIRGGGGGGGGGARLFSQKKNPVSGFVRKNYLALKRVKNITWPGLKNNKNISWLTIQEMSPFYLIFVMCRWLSPPDPLIYT